MAGIFGEDGARFCKLTYPFGLGAFAGTNQLKNRKAITARSRPRAAAEDEAERAVERTDAAVEDRVGNLNRDQRDDEQRAEEEDADRDR